MKPYRVALIVATALGAATIAGAVIPGEAAASRHTPPPPPRFCGTHLTEATIPATGDIESPPEPGGNLWYSCPVTNPA